MAPHTLSPLRWTGDALALIDQRLLPHRVEEVTCRSVDEVAHAIRSMVVRGAPAIGITAAYGMAIAARDSSGLDTLETAGETLRIARPTAVNLGWAVDRQLALARSVSSDQRGAALLEEAARIHAEDVGANRRMGELGADLLPSEGVVLTHCNAGALATGGWGTALGVVRSAIEAGKKVVVYADETRPWLQGARLTAWELAEDGIEVVLIADDMAGLFFRQKEFDAVVVGADRIAANGDVANKIGTYTLAVLAQAHGVPFYVAAPTSTIDLSCPDGDQIPIEERDPDEVRNVLGIDDQGQLRRVRIAPQVSARHPAFDVTPASLITAIITERGVVHAPSRESVAELMSRG